MSIERGSLLYQTGRHEAAEQEFRAALVEEPNNALAHAMVALCLVHQKKYAEATTEAQQAVGLRPDWDVGYSALASIYLARERLKEAASTIERAIQLDPFDPSHHGLLAEIRLKQRNWPAALTAADAGLAIDPEHPACVNARGIALVNLGRRDEANQTIGGALQRNPHNATTHANQGWALLHSGDHKAALEHFREALRINPESQWAKAGIVEAMKARNIIYRVMLRYFLFMSRMSRQVQWGIILGGYVGIQVVDGAAKSSPAFAPFALPIIIAYCAFVYMSWLAVPLFNLMLRLDKFGRYVLSRDQRVSSNLVGLCLGAGIILAVVAAVRLDFRFAVSAVVVAVLSIPFASIFNCTIGWPRWAMAAYGAGMSVFAMVVIGSLFYLNDLDRSAQWIHAYAIGVLVSSFLANGLSMASVRK